MNKEYLLQLLDLNNRVHKSRPWIEACPNCGSEGNWKHNYEDKETFEDARCWLCGFNPKKYRELIKEIENI